MFKRESKSDPPRLGKYMIISYTESGSPFIDADCRMFDTVEEARRYVLASGETSSILRIEAHGKPKLSYEWET